jgi:glycosyltransferase involved in cell wall biosynthesis
VDVLANVPSVLEVFHAADVAVFPDEHGVGIRNSVREALAAGTPVVATPVAAREQEPHPLLTVEENIDRIVERVVDYLTKPRTIPTAAELEPALRSWKDVTREYLGELHMAMSQNGHDQQRRTSTV